MDWMNRAGRPAQPAHTAAHGTPDAHTSPETHHKKKKSEGSTLNRVAFVVLLFASTLLVISLNVYLIFGKFTTRESKYVNDDKMQAVFLDGGQVYFGKVRAMNASYIGMTDIYYLRVNQQVQPKQGEQAQQDISLVKLGCELHGPTDEMFINRDKVLFWENLKTDGQVAKAVENYIKQNPDGQKCDGGDSSSEDTSGTDNTTVPTSSTPTNSSNKKP